jgi:hypothetical protein
VLGPLLQCQHGFAAQRKTAAWCDALQYLHYQALKRQRRLASLLCSFAWLLLLGISARASP